jgi:hypothetical protein
MRASSRRSHHCSSLTPRSTNRPRKTEPSTSKAERRASERTRFEAERRRQLSLRDRSQPLQAAAQNFDQRLLFGPHRLRHIFWQQSIRPGPCPRRHCFKLIEPFGCDPQCGLVRIQLRDALLTGERLQPVLPSGTCPHLLIGQAAEPQQSVMKFLGICCVGPCLGYLWASGGLS